MTDQAEDLVKAVAELVKASGADSFGVRFSDDDAPVVWLTVATYADGRAEAAGALTPAEAAWRLAEQIVDGGQCTRCDRPTALLDSEYPLTTPGVTPNLFCEYRYRAGKIRRGCDSMPVGSPSPGGGRRGGGTSSPARINATPGRMLDRRPAGRLTCAMKRILTVLIDDLDGAELWGDGETVEFSYAGTAYAIDLSAAHAAAFAATLEPYVKAATRVTPAPQRRRHTAAPVDRAQAAAMREWAAANGWTVTNRGRVPAAVQAAYQAAHAPRLRSVAAAAG